MVFRPKLAFAIYRMHCSEATTANSAIHSVVCNKMSLVSNFKEFYAKTVYYYLNPTGI